MRSSAASKAMLLSRVPRIQFSVCVSTPALSHSVFSIREPPPAGIDQVAFAKLPASCWGETSVEKLARRRGKTNYPLA
jgi:hypothetical protein